MNVVSIAPEEGMGRHVNLDERIAGRATVPAGRSLSLQAQHLSLADAARDRHIEAAIGRQRNTLLAAVDGGEEIDGEREAKVGAAPRRVAARAAPEEGE